MGSFLRVLSDFHEVCCAGLLHRMEDLASRCEETEASVLTLGARLREAECSSSNNEVTNRQQLSEARQQMLGHVFMVLDLDKSGSVHVALLKRLGSPRNQDKAWTCEVNAELIGGLSSQDGWVACLLYTSPSPRDS
eukprot:TRINITY_DN37250_c0_g1_i1.p2 TRINITY_DN37250_c0_g1~~TRINITY_DN37250_c0_g1_i1.p2  ORF type:complete len:136 (-),score=38.59 TRINITY_DN37250_c0_g1_i1:110-517(-)